MSTAASPSAFEAHTVRRPIIVMGVAGCGKSSVGARLAEALGLPYQEGDDLHPQANIAKMSKGTPLTDDDRWPWLDRIGEILADHASSGIVLTCSSLKTVYRDRLRAAAGEKLAFVFLDGSKALLTRRMGDREGHFMPTSLLESQLATLERPDQEADVVVVDIDNTPETIKDLAIDGLRRLVAG
ncbi:gluconokinase [Aliirhizobium smilacinae]|uniref:Gluconokinase n=1 Tax=Aliirhizobium smilacinae TaxID=1395944 RepID=A0A5C4XK12_9HYPH|nr:gluconokinase [Rhizobium smilacinae]TNM63647.1 gluconokinase [Rhizobium smilacinae]